MTAAQHKGRQSALLAAAFDRADDQRIIISRARPSDGSMPYVYRAYWRELDVPKYVICPTFGELLEALAGLQ